MTEALAGLQRCCDPPNVSGATGESRDVEGCSSKADSMTRVVPEVVAVCERVLLVALVTVEIAQSCDVFVRFYGAA